MNGPSTLCILAIVFAASVSLPLAAAAAGDEPAAPPAGGSTAAATVRSLCSELDTNKDGFVTREEAQKSPKLSANFNSIDTTRAGKISVTKCVSYLTHGAGVGAERGAAGRPAPTYPEMGSFPGVGGSPAPGNEMPPGSTGPSTSPKPND